MAYFEAVDARFAKYMIPVCSLETLHTGMRWAEGPVYFADGRYLVLSDIPNNRMLRWEEESGQVSVFRYPSGFSNGNTRDRQGRLVTCEHGNRRVTRTEPDGSITVLADRVGGKRLNSPNDVVVRSDGTVWFTDPPYGILTDYEGNKAESEIGGCHVYCCNPQTGEVSVVADDFVKPNGLAFSADERHLYVADSGRSHAADAPHHIRVFDVSDQGRLTNGRVFAEIDPGIPDGFRIDVDGNLWVGAGDGVHCFDAHGQLLGKILTPETVANVTFGGPKRNRLFIAATSTLFAVFVNTQGVQTP
jgi:gluconolactonase